MYTDNLLFITEIGKYIMAYKGRFRPKHPEKYKGDPTKIIYRSLWEFKVFKWLDLHNDVIWWQSEEVIVPYRSPIDGRIHRYFPDVIVHKKDGLGKAWHKNGQLKAEWNFKDGKKDGLCRQWYKNGQLFNVAI